MNRVPTAIRANSNDWQNVWGFLVLPRTNPKSRSMSKILGLLILVVLSVGASAQAILHIEQAGADSFAVIPMSGAIELVAGDPLLPYSVDGNKMSFRVPIQYPVQYVRVRRGGSSFYLPITEGEQIYRFLRSDSNGFETDNSFELGFQALQARSNDFVRPFQDNSGYIDKSIKQTLPAFIDSLKDQVKGHPYESDLRATFIAHFEYGAYRLVSGKRSFKKLNEGIIENLSHEPVLMRCWGYTDFLNTLLDDYYMHHMNVFNYPWRKYKEGALEAFIFEKELFEQEDLLHFLAFYKIKNLEYANDKNRLFALADSLLGLTKNEVLRLEISRYVAKSETRVKPLVQAPDFLLKEVGSDSLFKLSDFERKILILDFWATWCRPCVKSFKSVEDLHNRYQDSVHFVSISLDDSSAQAERFLVKHPSYSWTFLFDGQYGTTGLAYEAQAIPKYVIIDERGVILKEYQTAKEVEEWLKKRF